MFEHGVFEEYAVEFMRLVYLGVFILMWAEVGREVEVWFLFSL